MTYVFSDCKLDTQHHLLQRAGRAIHLRPKVFQALSYLIARRDHVVSKQELYAQIWPNLFLSNAVLDSTIGAVRQAIGDSGHTQRLIQTFHRYGYRFIAPVSVLPEKDSDFETRQLPSSSILSGAPVSDFPEAVGSALPLSPPPESASEQKLATILCCELAKAHALTMRRDTGVLHDLMQEFYDISRREMLRYGGTFHGVIGDHLVATFGAPMAQEDHAQDSNGLASNNWRLETSKEELIWKNPPPQRRFHE